MQWSILYQKMSSEDGVDGERKDNSFVLVKYLLSEVKCNVGVAEDYLKQIIILGSVTLPICFIESIPCHKRASHHALVSF